MSTTTDLSTLKINYLTQAQYDDALENDEINANEIYMTPIEETMQIKQASGSMVNVTDALRMPVQSLIADIDLIQSGSGDPSPSNVRSISGYSTVNIYVSPTNNAQDGTTYEVSFGSAGTVYNGTLDATTGTLTVTSEKKTLNGSEGIWSGTATSGGVLRAFTDKSYAGRAIIACESLKPFESSTTVNVIFVSSDGRLVVTPSWAQSATSLAEFKTLLASNNITLVRTLVTPQVYKVNVPVIMTLLNTNNVWAESGDIEMSYIAMD